MSRLGTLISTEKEREICIDTHPALASIGMGTSATCDDCSVCVSLSTNFLKICKELSNE